VENEEAAELLTTRRLLPVERLSLGTLRAAGASGVERRLTRERVGGAIGKGDAVLVVAVETRRRQNLMPNGLASG
jgi:hypothetical protein